MSETPKTYSIMMRVRRVIYEDAYIAIPVTDAIMKPKEDGSNGIDMDAFYAEAIRISGDLRVEWQQENITVQSHPIQQPLPEDRTCFDAFYTDNS